MHTIVAGDTFYLLAKKHNILLEDILNANPGVNPYNLQIGQQVCIPTHMAMPRGQEIEHERGWNGVIHTVRPGDTLYMLAKQYKLTLDDIMNANPQTDCYMLRVGMRLCIPTANKASYNFPLRTTPTMPSMPTTPTMPTMPSPTLPTRPVTPTPTMPTTPGQIPTQRPFPGTPTTPTMPSMPGMPTMPSTPTPTTPTRPVTPTPTTPTMPTMPTMPTTPTMPTMPTIPMAPTTPTMPTMPTMPMAPTTPSQTPTTTPACNGSMYKVKAGDTLYMLSKKYNITLDTLMEANPDLDPYNLRIGMQLCIPSQINEMTTSNMINQMPEMPNEGAENNCVGGSSYTTQRGDTLTRILDRYEISFGALQCSNPMVDFTDSLENMTLCIPSDDLFRTCPMSGAYIVKSGDTLDSISKRLLVITDSLLMENPTLSIEDFSIPGTKVCIPS